MCKVSKLALGRCIFVVVPGPPCSKLQTLLRPGCCRPPALKVTCDGSWSACCVQFAHVLIWTTRPRRQRSSSCTSCGGVVVGSPCSNSCTSSGGVVVGSPCSQVMHKLWPGRRGLTVFDVSESGLDVGSPWRSCTTTNGDRIKAAGSRASAVAALGSPCRLSPLNPLR